jgi:NodT family efflux transporter outer membrane factor (OMF) lipoprotein
VGPDFQKPQAPQTPVDYLATHESHRGAEAVALHDWPKLLPDEQLARLLKSALANNADVQIAMARLAQARAQQGVQEVVTGPRVDAAAKVSDDRLSTQSEMFANLPPGMAVKKQFDNRQVGFDASWELDFFGYQRRLNEGALARTESVRWHLDDVRLSLAAEVARQYVELRMNQQRTRLLQRQIELLEKSIRITEQAARAGELSPLDVARLNNALDNLQASLPLLAQARRQNLLALSVLTDLAATELQQALDDDIRTSTVPPVPAPPVSGLPADLMRHRPDVKAAERDWAAANADVGVAVALQYPRLTLAGSAGWNSIHSATLFDNASRLWSLGPELSLPIFESGRLKNQEQAARANLQAAQAQYHKTWLGAVADVDGALQRLAQNEQRRAQLLEAEQEQSRLWHLTEYQYKAGEASLLALLDMQRALLAQTDLSVQAQAQSVLDVVALYKALGGDWAPRDFSQTGSMQ